VPIANDLSNVNKMRYSSCYHVLMLEMGVKKEGIKRGEEDFVLIQRSANERNVPLLDNLQQRN
jgi:hypothetical protein